MKTDCRGPSEGNVVIAWGPEKVTPESTNRKGFLVRARWGWIGLVLLTGCTSVATVQPGSVYRANHLSEESLQTAITDNRIRTVVNVRGFEPEASWYREQREICERAGIEQVDITIADGQPNREEVIRLLETFRSAEKPILITGDRTSGRVGFASGLYRLAVLGESKEVAEKEIPFWQSRRLAFAGVGEYDQFLHNWRNENEFYAKYQLTAPSSLPTTASLLGQGPGLPPEVPERASVKLETPPLPVSPPPIAAPRPQAAAVQLGAPVQLGTR